MVNSPDARRRTLLFAFAIAPPVCALALVGARYGRQLADNESGALGVAALGFGALYLVAFVVALQRRAALSKIALAGWSATIVFCLLTTARMLYKQHKIDTRIYADTYGNASWVPDYYRDFRASSKSYWSPYVQWKRIPFESEYINVDARGRRRTWTAPGTPESAPRIFMFGGSTMWGSGAPDDDTIPSFVARGLAQEGQLARVENLGEFGYVSTQGLIRLLLCLRAGEVPDVVVFYDGANEIGAASQSGRAGVPLNERRREHDYLMGRGARPPTPPTLEPEELAREVVAAYAGNLEVLTALRDRYGFKLLCFWQPLPYVEKPLTDYEREATAEISPARLDLVRLVYAEVRSWTAPPFFHDLRSVFATQAEPRYVDWCHLGPRGNEEVAAAMLPHVRAALREMESAGAK